MIQRSRDRTRLTLERSRLLDWGSFHCHPELKFVTTSKELRRHLVVLLLLTEIQHRWLVCLTDCKLSPRVRFWSLSTYLSSLSFSWVRNESIILVDFFTLRVRRYCSAKSNPWRTRWQTIARLSFDTRGHSHSPTRILDVPQNPSSHREENERRGDKHNGIWRGSSDPKCISNRDADWSKVSCVGQKIRSTDDSVQMHCLIPSKFASDASIDTARKFDMTSFNSSLYFASRENLIRKRQIVRVLVSRKQ